MAVNRSIQDILTAIRTAIFGKDVRTAIADGIEKCYDDIKDYTDPITDLKSNIKEGETSEAYDFSSPFTMAAYDLKPGFINTTTGEIVDNTLNVVMKNIVRFGKGTTFYYPGGYAVTIAFYNNDLSYNRIQVLPTRSYTLTEDCYIRITMRPDPPVVIPDIYVVANNLSIYATSAVSNKEENNILHNSSDYIEKDYTIIKPYWKQGYVNTSGQEVFNLMNMDTIDILFMPIGSKIIADGQTRFSIHFYDSNGTWKSYSSYSSNTQYTFIENSYVRIVLLFNDTRTFTDPSIPNQHLTIFKNDVYSKANMVIQNLQGKSAKARFEWEYGYINITGIETYGANNNIKTVGKFTVGSGSYISIPTGISLSIHYFDNSGTWSSWEMHDGPYTKTFTETKSIVLSARYTTPAAIVPISAISDQVDINIMLPIDGINPEGQYWAGKKIVWFGTSIPAGVVNAGDTGGNGAYPTRVGNMLGATVYNESIDTSEVRAGTHGSYVSANDPMGYGGVSGPGLMYSLSLSSSEKQDIYDNWNNKWKDIITWFGDIIDMNNIENYKKASWDIMLNKYLTGGSVGPCDLYVFDHGYNDRDRDAQFTELDDIPSDPKDRKYWFGAMGFLFSKIYADNPKARIVIVGHYSTNQWSGDASTKYVCEAQEKLANYWNIPIIKTWEHMGFSFIEVTEGGNTFIPAQSWLPDLIHPAADNTGKSLQHYANVLYPLFRDLR